MVDTFDDLFETLHNFSHFLNSAFKQYLDVNKQNAECSHFLVPLGKPTRYLTCIEQIKYVYITRSSATAKGTARPSCLVGVLYDTSRERIC